MFPSVLNRKRRQGTLLLESNSLYLFIYFYRQALVSHWLFRYSLLFVIDSLHGATESWSSERISGHLSFGPPFITLLVTPVSYFRACNPCEQFDFRSIFLCFLTANPKFLQCLSFLSPRPRQLREEKRAIAWVREGAGVRRGNKRISLFPHLHYKSAWIWLPGKVRTETRKLWKGYYCECLSLITSHCKGKKPVLRWKWRHSPF